MWKRISFARRHRPVGFIHREMYRRRFDFIKKCSDGQEAALAQAVSNRELEIKLYWKRALYFWTLIGADFVAYGAVQRANVVNRPFIVSLLCSLGFILSLAWFLGNKGSKQWQENWENHVDLLEDDVHGPLHKYVVRRYMGRSQLSRGWKAIKEFPLGPGRYSVSKINQLISLFVAGSWILLAIISNTEAVFTLDYRRWDFAYTALFLLTILSALFLLVSCRSDLGIYQLEVEARCSWVADEPDRKPVGKQPHRWDGHDITDEVCDLKKP